MPEMKDVLAVILGGGVGKRLYPLTRQRSKPAVPIAGKYRLIDVPISNCINSNIHRIDVLTQFNSVSLHRHIQQTYRFDSFSRGWVDILAAEQTPRSTGWYQGTADAVRKQLFEIRATHAKYVLVLAGDHLYRMDYQELAEFHWGHNADITVAVQPVEKDEASRFGLLKRGMDDRITAFVEKSRDPEVLREFVSRDDSERPFIGSMGIYLFNTEVLFDLLESSDYQDFGGEIIPNALQGCNVVGFDFEDYWADIGTIRSYYDVSLALCCPDPPFNFYDSEQPIYTRRRFLPSTVVYGAKLENVLVAEGGNIQGGEIRNSIVGLRSQIRDGVRLVNSIMMGADYYDPEGEPPPGGIPGGTSGVPLGIGANCSIEGAIIDKNARIGENVVIQPFPRGTEIDEGNWVVQDGIVVLPKGSVIYPGTHIGPG